MSNQLQRGRKIPHTYVILIGLIFIISVLSYIIPAGNYDLVEVNGRNVVDPTTFHYVEDATPVTPMEFLTAIPRGLEEAAEISFFIFILGGAFNIINATGAMEVGIGNMAKKLQKFPGLIIPVFVIVFSVLGGTIGLSEETIIFVPIGILLARSLGYDAIVGTAIVFLGAAVGFNSGFMNPFTVGVAHGLAELPVFSGITYRLIIWGIFNVVTILYIYRYATTVRANPEKSVVRHLELEQKGDHIDLESVPPLTKTHKAVMVAFILGIAAIVYGVFVYEYYIVEIAAIFLAMAVICGAIGRIAPSEMAKLFIAGAKDVTMGALVVGIARGILVVLNDGQILYTVVHSVANMITLVPRAFAAIFMFIFQLLLNFFIPSGSGQAATTMPIMIPLADIIGITRQTAVTAFHLGDGISNSIIPTGGSLLAALSVAEIDYEEWVRFVWPIILIWTVLGAAFVAVATIMNYGPF